MWRDFVRDNGLRLRDACVFKLVVPTSVGAGTTEVVAATAPDRKEKDSSSKDKKGKTMEVHGSV